MFSGEIRGRTEEGFSKEIVNFPAVSSPLHKNRRSVCFLRSPRCSNCQELNAQLVEQSRKGRERRPGGHEQTIAERFHEDAGALLPSPVVPYEAGEKRSTRVTSLSLVPCRNNGYSVPTA